MLEEFYTAGPNTSISHDLNFHALQSMEALFHWFLNLDLYNVVFPIYLNFLKLTPNNLLS